MGWVWVFGCRWQFFVCVPCFCLFLVNVSGIVYTERSSGCFDALIRCVFTFTHTHAHTHTHTHTHTRTPLPPSPPHTLPPSQPGSSSRMRNDFLTEASISGQFKHPHVIKLYGVVTLADPVMIVMEFMDNGSLYNYLRVSSFPCPKCVAGTKPCTI